MIESLVKFHPLSHDPLTKHTLLLLIQYLRDTNFGTREPESRPTLPWPRFQALWEREKSGLCNRMLVISHVICVGLRKSLPETLEFKCHNMGDKTNLPPIATAHI